MNGKQIIPLNRLQNVEGVVFMATLNEHTGNVSVQCFGKKTQVFVEDGDFDSLNRRFPNKRVSILNRGLVNNYTAIEIDVQVQRFESKPRRARLEVPPQQFFMGEAA